MRQIRQGEAKAKAADGEEESDETAGGAGGADDTFLTGQQQGAAANAVGVGDQPVLDARIAAGGAGVGGRRSSVPVQGTQAHAHAAAEDEEMEGALDDNEDEGDAAFTANIQQQR